MQRLAGFEVEDVGFRGPTSLVEAIYYYIILLYIALYYHILLYITLYNYITIYYYILLYIIYY